MKDARPVVKSRSKRTQKEEGPAPVRKGTKGKRQIEAVAQASSVSRPGKEPGSGSEQEISVLSNRNAKRSTISVEHDGDERNNGTETENESWKKKEQNEDMVPCRFSVHRVKRIAKDNGGAGFRMSQEALFLTTKASEKFLEQFSKEAYARAMQDDKNSIAYQHLSSTVCKEKRLDFLSDFIPEKVKAEAALEERKQAVHECTL